ncbi:MAG: sugar phosphate isomerase/epimerase [Burkholderiaceae bacterium]
MKTPLSIQLYSLRTLPGLSEVLDAVRRAGYRHVELIGSHLDAATDVRKQLDARELSASSSHVGLDALRERFDAVVAGCKTLGFTQLFMPAVPSEERLNGEPYWTALGRELGQMATRAKDRGIDLGYHNHDWELKRQADGRSALECLFAGAGASPLAWQADVAWLVRGGADPVAWMQEHKARLISVHAKDLAPAGTKQDEDGWADVGHGVLDWRGRLAPAAAANGARWLVAEHDKPSDPLRFARNSFSFLNSL